MNPKQSLFERFLTYCFPAGKAFMKEISYFFVVVFVLFSFKTRQVRRSCQVKFICRFFLRIEKYLLFFFFYPSFNVKHHFYNFHREWFLLDIHNYLHRITITALFITITITITKRNPLCERCPNMEFFLVRFVPYSD